jgi:membrane protein DedA with SNARE-associated domain
VPPVLVQLLGDYGYGLLALLVFSMNAGVPVPGHAAYLAACALCADKALELPFVFVTGTVAAFLGAWLGFYGGQRGGRQLVESVGPRVGLNAARLAALERFFAKHGAKAVFFSRFIIVVRTFGNLFAGMSGLPTKRFLVVTAAGAAAWGVAYALVGTLFRESWTVIEDTLGETGLIVLGAVAVIGLAYVWVRRRKKL